MSIKLKTATASRRLEWSDYDIDVLEDVAAVLAITNPGRGQTADYIRNMVESEFYNRNLTTFIGTGGWYVTVYPSLGDPDVWRALPTLMPYTVKKYLASIAHKLLPEA